MGDLAQKIPSLDDAGDILLEFSSTILRQTLRYVTRIVKNEGKKSFSFSEL